MKIILFTENNRVGGLDTFIRTIIESWPDPNHTFLIISNKSHPGATNLQKLSNPNVGYIGHNIPLNWDLFGLGVGLSNQPFCRALRGFLRVWLAPFQFWMLKKLFRRLSADKLLVVNGAYPGGESCRMATLAWSSYSKSKSIHTVHNYFAPVSTILRPFELLVDKLLVSTGAEIITVSEACLETIKNRPVLHNSGLASYIHNGVQSKISSGLSTPCPFQKLSKTNKHFYKLLMLGCYEARKGHSFIFDVMKVVIQSVPNTKLFCFGDSRDGELAAMNSDLLALRLNGHVNLSGFVSDATELLKHCDVVVIPSQDQESFCLVATEAMAFGKPIVSTNVGGLAEVVGRSCEAGFIFDRSDVKGFGEAIVLLLQDSNLRTKIGNRGKKRLDQKFSSKKMAENYWKILFRC